jgi:hypothetical protein
MPRPTLGLTLTFTRTYSANGLDGAYDDAYQTSTKALYPKTVVGGSIVIPLDVFTAKKAADGYALNYQSSKSLYEDKILASRQDWAQLKKRLDDVNRRLELALEIEKIQKEKAEEERRQLNLGVPRSFKCRATKRITPSLACNVFPSRPRSWPFGPKVSWSFLRSGKQLKSSSQLGVQSWKLKKNF